MIEGKSGNLTGLITVLMPLGLELALALDCERQKRVLKLAMNAIAFNFKK
jgi:hypothetical protein